MCPTNSTYEIILNMKYYRSDLKKNILVVLLSTKNFTVILKFH